MNNKDGHKRKGGRSTSGSKGNPWSRGTQIFTHRKELPTLNSHGKKRRNQSGRSNNSPRIFGSPITQKRDNTSTTPKKVSYNPTVRRSRTDKKNSVPYIPSIKNKLVSIEEKNITNNFMKQFQAEESMYKTIFHKPHKYGNYSYSLSELNDIVNGTCKIVRLGEKISIEFFKRDIDDLVALMYNLSFMDNIDFSDDEAVCSLKAFEKDLIVFYKNDKKVYITDWMELNNEKISETADKFLYKSVNNLSELIT